MPRRPLVALAVVAVSAWMVLGLVPAASAATVGPVTVNGITFYANDTNVAAGALAYAYSGASTALVIPDTVDINAVTYNVTKININAFDGDGLTSVVLPSTLLTIGDGAFQGDVLTSLTLPPSLTTIGNNAFQSNAITSLVVPDSVTSLGADAFLGNQLTSLTLGTGITQVAFGAFQGNLLTSIDLPPTITSIGMQAFATNHLVSIDFQGPVTTISQGAFAGNDLTSVTFPPTVTDIGLQAFYGNLPLTSFTFTGPAPSVVPLGGSGSLESGGAPVVNYLWAYDAAQTPGGFTSPAWQGYDSQEWVTRTFDLGGHGTAIDPQLIPAGASPAAPPAPTATQLTFKGWYTDAALTTKADFADPLTADQTLFARWDPTLAVTGGTIDFGALCAALIAASLGTGLLLWVRRRRTS